MESPAYYIYQLQQVRDLIKALESGQNYDQQIYQKLNEQKDLLIQLLEEAIKKKKLLYEINRLHIILAQKRNNQLS